MFQNTAKRAHRRGFPIMGYVGPNGGGKSAAMVWDTLPSLAAGRPVLGTVRLLDWRKPRECTDTACEADPLSGHYIRALPAPHVVRAIFDQVTDSSERVRLMRETGPITGVHQAAHPLWIPLTDWQQVLDARGMDLLLDEVTGAASSRESAALPAAIANKLVQLRRNDVVVRWSAPAWARADKIIRECSQAVTYCRGFLPKTVAQADRVQLVEDEADEEGAIERGADRMWRHRRLFNWKTFDALDFEDFTAGKREELHPLTNDLHWGPKSPAFAAYDTFDAVLTVGTVTETGTCYRCGGARSRPTCSCPDYAPRSRTRSRRGAPAGAPEGGGRGAEAPGLAPDAQPPESRPLVVVGRDGNGT